MEMGLKGKVAIVAASSKGLGKAIAKTLAEEGAKLTIFSRDLDEINKAADDIRRDTDCDILPLQADVTNDNDLKSVFEKTIAYYSTVHILVNNAGGPPFGTFDDFNETQWSEALELNLLSTINMSRYALPYMKEQRWGRIINITSIAVKQPIDGLILSNTVRAGVIGFAKTLSNEYARYNVLVNNVCPGRILTDRILHLADERAKLSGNTRDDVIRMWEADIPMGRLGNTEELAHLVAFLASERASYITGTTIQVDGGAVKSIF